MIAIVVLALGPILLNAIVRRRLRKQRDLFLEQLPGHLEELASAMRAGHSFVSGINAVATAAVEPSRAAEIDGWVVGRLVGGPAGSISVV